MTNALIIKELTKALTQSEPAVTSLGRGVKTVIGVYHNHIHACLMFIQIARLHRNLHGFKFQRPRPTLKLNSTENSMVVLEVRIGWFAYA